MKVRNTPPLEYTGCIVNSNRYIKLGLSPAQNALLSEWAKTGPITKKTSSAAAWMLLNTALANIEVMEQLMHADFAETQSHGKLSLLEYHWEAKAKNRRYKTN
jgi:hypothetical protein